MPQSYAESPVILRAPEVVHSNREHSRPFTIQEEIISDLLCHLDQRKSVEPDGIQPRVLSKPMKELAKPLSIIYH